EVVKEAMRDANQTLAGVQLLQGEALDLAKIPLAVIDTAILNSVVQYFPTQQYLRDVIEQLVQGIRSGGALFIGDVRSLMLLKLFHTSVQMAQGNDSSTCGELRNRITTRMRGE